MAKRNITSMLLLVIFCVRIAGAIDDCSTCVSKLPTSTCLGQDNSVDCQAECEENSTAIFSLTAEKINFYPHAGDNVALAVNLTANESTTIDIDVNVIFNETEYPTTKTNGEYVYTIDGITKDHEGEKIIFRAVGTWNGLQICASTTLNIKYVYTVSLRTEETNYVFKTSDPALHIPIHVSADEPSFERIIVYENSPFTGKGLIKPPAQNGSDRIYDYHIASPTKKSVEGEYGFWAEEHAEEVLNYATPRSHVSIYIHSTIVTTTKENAYFVQEKDNVTLAVSAKTGLESWDTIRMDVKLPRGDVEAINLDGALGSETNVSYNISEVNLRQDSGVYVFTAAEITEQHGNTTDSVEIRVFSSTVTSELSSDDRGYLMDEGSQGNITCELIGGPGDINWYRENMKVTTNSSSNVYQMIGVEKEERTLVISDASSYDSGVYTCETKVNGVKGTRSVTVAIGEIRITSYSAMGGVFKCTASGNPKPTITWKIDNEVIEDVSYFNLTTTVIDPHTVMSSLSIDNPLCFGDQQLICNASSTNGSVAQEYAINNYDVYIHHNHYVAFSDKENVQDDAAADCTSRGGSLAKIEGDDYKKEITSFADTSRITDFYIGAQKDDSGKWKWPDDSDVTYPDLPTTDENRCSKLSKLGKKSGSWTAQTVDCGEEIKFACEIVAPAYPKDLVLNTAECDGTALAATWNIGGDGAKNVIIQLSAEDGSQESDQKEELDPTDKERNFSGLTPDTEYKVKITVVVHERCSLHPYAEQEATTGNGSLAASVAEISNANDTACKITWTHEEEERANVKQFYVSVREHIRHTSSSDDSPQEKTYVLSNDAMELDIPARPNSKYSAKVYAEYDCGNSSGAETTGTCTTDVSSPDSVPLPAVKISTQDTGLTILIPAVDGRNGDVSCQFVVVRYVRPDVPHSSPDITDSKFSNIKDANIDVINIGDEYLAFATERLSSAVNITLGAGGDATHCVPLPILSARKRREVTSNQTYSALNRPIKYGMQVQYYMITTTPSEDGKSVFFENSPYSTTYVLHQRPSGKPNAAAIVVSILAVILALVVGVFCYRKWRARRKATAESSHIFRFSKDHHYDVL